MFSQNVIFMILFIHFKLKIGLGSLMRILTGALLLTAAMNLVMLFTTKIMKSCLCTHRHCRPLTCAATGTERWRRTRWRSPWRHIGLTFACPTPPRSKGRSRRRMDADVGTSATTSVPQTLETAPPPSRSNSYGRWQLGVRHSGWFGTRLSSWIDATE